MLTNIPTGTPLYMLVTKCEFRGAPEPRRFEVILHHTRDGPRFSVPAGGPQPARDLIHLDHLVNYCCKYVSPTSGYVDEHPLEFLFLVEDHHKDRSLAALEVDRLEGKDFDEDYNCEDCAPRACVCCECCEFYEEDKAEEPAPEAPEIAAFRARLKEIEKKVDTVLACQEMLRGLKAMKLGLM